MSIHHRIPESIRAVGEELRFLLQPRIWLGVGVLAVVGIFFWQFSENPEWFSLDPDSTVNPGNSGSQLTPEQQSIAADIDNSKVLLEALGGNNSLAGPRNTNIEVNNSLLKPARDQAKKTESISGSNPLLEGLLNLSPPKTQAFLEGNSPKPANLGNRAAESPPVETNSGSNLGLKGLGSPSAAAQNPEAPKTSLQQAMQNYLQTQETENNTVPSDTADGTNNSVISGTNSTDTPGDSLVNPNRALNPISPTTVGVTPFTGAPTIVGEVAQPSWSVPRSNPNPAIGIVPLAPKSPYQTNVTLPPVLPAVPTVTPGTDPIGGYSNFNSSPLNNSIPSYTITPNTNINSTVQPVQPNNYMTPSNLNPNIQQGQISQPQPNFSLPNSVPGRYIGGGEINTFANP
ncbi:MAG TPA: hypothetical protein DEF27_04565 [Oscillatoriales bacterium UBA8482]|nr:MAG: hypothetical protein AUK43_16990 [Oscillatoriales cyanobacterium CG2_30_40_61]HBW57097.1 hypothetical protein [Oscillatoriales bacterium UBA8482]